MNSLEHYLSLLRNPEKTISPAIVSKEKIEDIIQAFSWIRVESLDELTTGDLPQVSLYRIPEGKKHFDILTVRSIIRDISLEPYSGKNLSLLIDIDTATLEAQNALLKTLEDCPPYAIIVLAVSNPEWLIETIHSRSMVYNSTLTRESLTKEEQEMVYTYYHGDTIPMIRYLFSGSYTGEKAIEILRESMWYCGEKQSQQHEEAIIELIRGIDPPRNILEGIFLIQDGV